MVIRIKIYWLLLLVAVIGIVCVYCIDINEELKENEKTEQRLDSAKKAIDDFLWRSRLERDSLNCVIDSIARSRKVVIEKIKAIPVIIPNNYDGLTNKQLEKEMLDVYIRSKNKSVK